MKMDCQESRTAVTLQSTVVYLKSNSHAFGPARLRWERAPANHGNQPFTKVVTGSSLSRFSNGKAKNLLLLIEQQ
jgi:hypothetical protein